MLKLISMTVRACFSQGRWATTLSAVTALHMYYGVMLLFNPNIAANSFFLHGLVDMLRGTNLLATTLIVSSLFAIYAMMLPSTTAFTKPALLFLPQMLIVGINVSTAILLQSNPIMVIIIDRAPFMSLSIFYFVGVTRYMGRYGHGI